MFLKVENLTKYYDKLLVLKDVNLVLQPNMCFCIIGKNGSGKSTFLKCIMNLIEFNQGKIEIDNINYSEYITKNKNRVGYLGENLNLIEELTPNNYFKLLLYLLGNDSRYYGHLEYLIDFFFEDKSYLQKSISKLSKGNKMKVALISTLFYSPELLILDEPFDGLDLITSHKLIQYINKIKNENRIIIIASHTASHIEKIATKIGIIRNNQIDIKESINHLLKNSSDFENELINLLNNTELPNECR